MDHQKLNILLIFGTFSFGGCGGQGCYFWSNPRVISKRSAIQDSQMTFKPNLACIFLPARAKWDINVCVETPCTSKRYVTTNKTSQCTYMCWIKVNVLTSDNNYFYKLMISQKKKNCENDVGQIKPMYSHLSTLTFVPPSDVINKDYFY